jgi:hypothetical protein
MAHASAVTVFVAAALAGCVPHLMTRDDLLTRLRRDLDEARAPPPVVYLDKDEPEDLSPLRGMKLDEIEAALGEPFCRARGAHRCFDDADLVYLFFPTPPGVIPGGPTLRVYSDRHGICRGASWIITE